MSMTQKELDEFFISLFGKERDDANKVIDSLAVSSTLDAESAKRTSRLLERLVEYLEKDLERLTQKS